MKSVSPHTQAVGTPGGAEGACGTSFRWGNLVQSGSKGMVVAVLCIVRKSLTWPSRPWAVDLSSAINLGKRKTKLRE